jgi:hypothetical protein
MKKIKIRKKKARNQSRRPKIMRITGAMRMGSRDRQFKAIRRVLHPIVNLRKI